jgi:hypothetical protein
MSSNGVRIARKCSLSEGYRLYSEKVCDLEMMTLMPRYDYEYRKTISILILKYF